MSIRFHESRCEAQHKRSDGRRRIHRVLRVLRALRAPPRARSSTPSSHNGSMRKVRQSDLPSCGAQAAAGGVRSSWYTQAGRTRRAEDGSRQIQSMEHMVDLVDREACPSTAPIFSPSSAGGVLETGVRNHEELELVKSDLHQQPGQPCKLSECEAISMAPISSRNWRRRKMPRQEPLGPAALLGSSSSDLLPGQLTECSTNPLQHMYLPDAVGCSAETLETPCRKELQIEPGELTGGTPGSARFAGPLANKDALVVPRLPLALVRKPCLPCPQAKNERNEVPEVYPEFSHIEPQVSGIFGSGDSASTVSSFEDGSELGESFFTRVASMETTASHKSYKTVSSDFSPRCRHDRRDAETQALRKMVKDLKQQLEAKESESSSSHRITPDPGTETKETEGPKGDADSLTFWRSRQAKCMEYLTKMHCHTERLEEKLQDEVVRRTEAEAWVEEVQAMTARGGSATFVQGDYDQLREEYKSLRSKNHTLEEALLTQRGQLRAQTRQIQSLKSSILNSKPEVQLQKLQT